MSTEPRPLPGDPLAALARELLAELGEDPDREALLRTPARVAESLRFLTQGYGIDVKDVVRDAVYAEPYEEMVLVRDVEVYSLCEHHLLPFYG
ncbi:MAG TPA: GTP cyclohydrolase I FolE, partial [Chloroflexi bacterium]|nr:GTP cyclohydrolase I FolE [Chloroflexota bacterium]